MMGTEEAGALLTFTFMLVSFVGSRTLLDDIRYAWGLDSTLALGSRT